MGEVKEKEKQFKINMVSHVHWDPMWYSSYQEYRIRLYSLVKKLIRILENNSEYKYFMFDGQVSAIEDYLELVPKDEEKIRKFVRDGRLYLGPWYIQPEEFLISGESLIRNLKLGLERAEKLGGVMKVSYLCDPVGHIAQLPQIVSGFGIKYFAASRGLFDNDKIKTTEFIWEAPDGSELLVHTMPKGYSNALPLKQETFDNAIVKYRDELASANVTGYILYAQGCDHGEPMEEALELVKEYNKKAGREEITFTTLDQHMQTIEDFRDRLPRYMGEMRFSYNIFMLSGILTTRMEIKFANAGIQNGLERWLEPFSAINWLLGDEYPEAFINLAWEYQIKNTFHDCIYGAHADHVTPDILNDYKQAQEIIHWKTNDSLYAIASRAANEGSGYRIVIFNPTIRNRVNQVIDCELFLSKEVLNSGICIYNTNGEILPSQLNKIESSVKFSSASGNIVGETKGKTGYKCAISILVNEIPAFGYITVLIKNDKKVKYETDLSIGTASCENSYLKLEINSNGTINVYDKANRNIYNELHYFEDSGDRGDQYNYSPTIPAGIITSKSSKAKITLESNGPVKAIYKIELELLLPEGLSSEGLSRSSKDLVNRIITYITLRAYSQTIEFHTEVHNNSGDHRLTVAFQTDIDVQYIDSGSQFYINRRDIKLPSAEGWYEPPSPFRPHHRFFCIEDKKRNFTFMDRGLTEHKVTEEGEVYVTLLRCTSQLSKDTLPERMCWHAGPAMETPGAQEIGIHKFDYAVYFQSGSMKLHKSINKSQEFETPVRGFFLDEQVKEQKQSGISERMSFFSLEEGEDVILSAIKKGNENNIIIRLFNSSGKRTETRLISFLPLREAAIVDLEEYFIKNLDFEGKELLLTIEAFKIITLSLKFEEDKWRI